MKLGISWREWEVQFVFENYTEIGATGCHKRLPHRSVNAIRAAAQKLGLKYEYVSNVDIEEAARLYQSRQMTVGQLAKKYSITVDGLRYQFRAHGIKQRPPFDGIKKNGYWEVPLTRGHFALVDDSDYSLICNRKWTYFVNQDGKKYAMAGQMKNGVRTTLYMHRVIMKAKRGEMVDHESAHTLDNRRFNLRIANKFQNQWNRKFRGSRSGFKGVVSNGPNGWAARITKHKRTYCLGTYRTPIEAARVYDKSAKRLFGRFAEVNFK